MSSTFKIKAKFAVPNSNKDRKATLRDAIKSNLSDSLRVEPSIPSKGRGVIATRNFAKGDFIIEYKGKVITNKEALSREEKYKAHPEIGCYMYYFIDDGKRLCVDATKEDGNLGRLDVYINWFCAYSDL